jgi:uncharacterized protein
MPGANDNDIVSFCENWQSDNPSYPKERDGKLPDFINSFETAWLTDTCMCGVLQSTARRHRRPEANMRARAVILMLLFAVPVQLCGQQIDLAALSREAESGNVKAQVALAQGYEERQNYDAAIKWYRAAAEKGDPEAQNGLGVMYRLGRGVEKDPAEAVKWYRKAVRQGYAPAMFNMGTAYYNGDGVAIDDAHAYIWFRLGAEAGDQGAAEALRRLQSELSPPRLIDAQLKLADLLRIGDDIPSNPLRAAGYYREAASNGSLVAMVRIAEIMLTGLALPAEFGTARQWCDRAAGEKYSAGMFCLGYMYENGAGVSPNMTEAFRWYQKSAEAGYLGAAEKIGNMYANGTGVPQDNEAAYMWYWLANSGGSERAAAALEAVAAKLNKHQIESAQKKAKKYQRDPLTGLAVRSTKK